MPVISPAAPTLTDTGALFSDYSSSITAPLVPLSVSLSTLEADDVDPRDVTNNMPTEVVMKQTDSAQTIDFASLFVASSTDPCMPNAVAEVVAIEAVGDTTLNAKVATIAGTSLTIDPTSLNGGTDLQGRVYAWDIVVNYAYYRVRYPFRVVIELDEDCAATTKLFPMMIGGFPAPSNSAFTGVDMDADEYGIVMTGSVGNALSPFSTGTSSDTWSLVVVYFDAEGNPIWIKEGSSLDDGAADGYSDQFFVAMNDWSIYTALSYN